MLAASRASTSSTQQGGAGGGALATTASTMAAAVSDAATKNGPRIKAVVDADGDSSFTPAPSASSKGRVLKLQCASTPDVADDESPARTRGRDQAPKDILTTSQRSKDSRTGTSLQPAKEELDEQRDGTDAALQVRQVPDSDSDSVVSGEEDEDDETLMYRSAPEKLNRFLAKQLKPPLASAPGFMHNQKEKSSSSTSSPPARGSTENYYLTVTTKGVFPPPVTTSGHNNLVPSVSSNAQQESTSGTSGTTAGGFL
eukprot:GSA120T00001668001.1